MRASRQFSAEMIHPAVFMGYGACSYFGQLLAVAAGAAGDAVLAKYPRAVVFTSG
ncbi:hypothetical protein N9445_00185 [bacterium]|nr:hypothetical protein [bacterium]